MATPANSLANPDQWFVNGGIRERPITTPTQGLLIPGNINLYNRPHVKNPDGSVSTVRSMSFEEDGKEILIPTVGDDGRILSNTEAISRYKQTGKHLGIFKTPEEATRYAEALHNEYANGKYDIRERPLTERPQEDQVPTGDKVIDFLRPIISGGVSGIAGSVATPFTSPIGGAAAGMGAYTLTDLGLKGLKSTHRSQSFKEALDTLPGDAFDSAKEAVMNEVGGQALNYGGKLVRGLRQGVSNSITALEPTTSQLYKKVFNKEAPLARWLEDSFSNIGPFAGKKARQEVSQQLGQQELEKTASALTGRPISDATDPYFLAANIKTDAENLAGAFKNPPALFSKNGLRQLINTNDSPIPILDNILSDADKTQRLLDAGNIRIPGIGTLMSNNIRQDAAGYKLGDLARKGASAAYEELSNPVFSKNEEVLKKVFSAQTRGNLEQLFKNISIVEEKRAGGGWTSHLPAITLYHGAFSIPLSLLTGHMALAETSAIVTGATIGGVGMAKLLANPKVARALVSLAGGQPAGMSEAALSRMVVGALQGSGAAISLFDKSGKEIKGSINPDGTFESSQPTEAQAIGSPQLFTHP